MAKILIFLLSIFLFSSCGNGSSSPFSTSEIPHVALTTLEVTLNTDNNPGGIGDPGELRYALNIMNQDLNSIPDDYAITFAFPMTIQLNGILPIINNSSNPVNITIGNPGSTPTVTIDGNSGSYSGFFIANGNVTIQNMIFQNMTARGGDGGDGISGGGGGLGAGGAIYVPETFMNGSYPSVILSNVLISYSSAVGGNGGNYFSLSATGNEGGGGGGGFSGNGGSIMTTGSTGGAGGGGFGGNGGDVTLSTDFSGGGGGGGGGLGSRATLGMLTNLGNGGSDQENGLDGNGYDLLITGGDGAGGYIGGSHAGGGGGGGDSTGGGPIGGGGGGSGGSNGQQPQGNIPPDLAVPSGGSGGDGGGGGGGGVVMNGATNGVDGQPGSGGYGGGGGGGAGIGSSDIDYRVQGGEGGIGGGGGGGGVNQSGSTSAEGGNSLGGGGGGGGGPANGVSAQLGGTDTGNLGGGSGGSGAEIVGAGSGGGGGGGGSGLGGAIFVDSNLNLTLQALSGIPTTFNTSNNTTQAGSAGTAGSGGGTDGTPGSALGNSIFLRSGSSLTLMAEDSEDLLTLGEQVAFIDDTLFGLGGTSVFVRGNGTVIYNGTTDYQGSVTINNANFKVNGQISEAPVNVCRNSSFSVQRGTLSGTGTVTGAVMANSGTISPDAGGTLTLGSLTLNSASTGALGSLVHIEIDSSGTSLVAVNGPATLAGILEIDLDSSAAPGTYTLLTSTGITGAFDSVSFTGATPTYSLSYKPIDSPTYVEFILTSTPPPTPPSAADLNISIQGPSDAVDVDSQTSFQINIANPDDESIEDLTAQLTLSENLSFISSELSVNSNLSASAVEAQEEICDGTNPVSCSIDTISAGQSVTLNVIVKALSAGPMSLAVTISNEDSTSSTVTANGTVTNGSNNDFLSGSTCSLNRKAVFSQESSLLLLFVMGGLISIQARKRKLREKN